VPILYPANLDSLTNPTSSDTLAGVPHATQHSDENDAIVALETKLGTGASTPATPGHVLRVSGPGATAYAAIQEGDIPAAIARDSEVTDAVAAHEADTTSVHGIADTTVLATDAEVAAAVDAHTGDASAAHAASAVSVLDSEGQIAATDVEAALAELPKGEIGYAQITADQTGITTETDLTGLSVAVTVPAGRRIRISAEVLLLSTVEADALGLEIKEDAAYLRRARARAHADNNVTVSTSVILTPSSGAHTYKLVALRVSGTGTVTVTAAASYPAFILVEDLGAA